MSDQLNPVARVVKGFWDFMEYLGTTAGFGMALALGAMWDGGILPGLICAVGIVGSLILVLVSTGWRRRHLRFTTLFNRE